MDWLKAASVVALGMITAIRIGLGAVVGAGGLVGAAVAAMGAAVVGTGAAVVGVAGVPQAATSMTINNPTINKLLFFIFYLLLVKVLIFTLFKMVFRYGRLPSLTTITLFSFLSVSHLLYGSHSASI
jgi:serine acetyltransferase